jgi:hypothetical protein
MAHFKRCPVTEGFDGNLISSSVECIFLRFDGLLLNFDMEHERDLFGSRMPGQGERFVIYSLKFVSLPSHVASESSDNVDKVVMEESPLGGRCAHGGSSLFIRRRWDDV